MCASKLVLYGLGDRVCHREDYIEQMKFMKPVLEQADIRYGQYEGLISDKGHWQVGCPKHYRVDPKFINVLKGEGYDILSPNGNHAMEYGHEALVDCKQRLDAAGIRALGIGANLAEARTPVIIERDGTTIAFLAYNSINIKPGWAATANAPGFVPMHVFTYYEPAEVYQPGTPPWTRTFCDRKDLALMVEDIQKAKQIADIVVVCPHVGVHWTRAVLAEYQIDLAHAAIDAGADVIIASHPHVLKGIEVYNGKVIFHSMGNYAFDPIISADGKPEVPAGLAQSEIGRLFHLKFDPEYPFNEMFGSEALMTGIARVEIADKKISKCSFIPILTNKLGQPVPQKAGSDGWKQVTGYMQDISKEAGLDTSFKTEGDQLVVITG